MGHVLTMPMTVTGSVESFDEQSFARGLATILKVAIKDIQLTVSSGSVEVIARVVFSTPSAASNAATRIAATSMTAISDATGASIQSRQDAYVAVEQISAPSPPVPSAPPEPPSPPSLPPSPPPPDLPSLPYPADTVLSSTPQVALPPAPSAPLLNTSLNSATQPDSGSADTNIVPIVVGTSVAVGLLIILVVVVVAVRRRRKSQRAGGLKAGGSDSPINVEGVKTDPSPSASSMAASSIVTDDTDADLAVDAPSTTSLSTHTLRKSCSFRLGHGQERQVVVAISGGRTAPENDNDLESGDSSSQTQLDPITRSLHMSVLGKPEPISPKSGGALPRSQRVADDLDDVFLSTDTEAPLADVGPPWQTRYASIDEDDAEKQAMEQVAMRLKRIRSERETRQESSKRPPEQSPQPRKSSTDYSINYDQQRSWLERAMPPGETMLESQGSSDSDPGSTAAALNNRRHSDSCQSGSIRTSSRDLRPRAKSNVQSMLRAAQAKKERERLTREAVEKEEAEKRQAARDALEEEDRRARIAARQQVIDEARAAVKREAAEMAMAARAQRRAAAATSHAVQEAPAPEDAREKGPPLMPDPPPARARRGSSRVLQQAQIFEQMARAAGTAAAEE